MAGFLIKRCAQAVFVVLAVTLLVAWAVRLSGDPAIMMTQGAGSFTAQDLENIRKALGLDRPFSVQYLEFVKDLVTFELGNSFFGGMPVARLIRDALPSTLLLASVSLLVSLAISVPLGVYAADRKSVV
jgi:peptide/nickel transport system permease protein